MNPDLNRPEQSRRSFIKQSAAGALAVTALDMSGLARSFDSTANTMDDRPWYQRVARWGQVNITEKDPPQYDISWWRSYWMRTKTKGVIVNAGGIVAYYPTKIPLHKKAVYLEGRDLFGDICKAAQADGLAVFARMDSNRADETFYRAHPDWFAIDGKGNPYKSDDLFITCVNSPYYNEHIPSILREITELYHPEGFTDNSWSGLGRDKICYCENCRKHFRDKNGYDIPVVKNWDDPAYRQWIYWNYERRLEIWDLNNRVTRSAGGPHCIWSGMNSGSINGQAKSFRDFKAICERADIIMLDDQARSDAGGFQHNGEIGKLIHGLLGWNKLVPESMAMYQAHDPWFRVASKPKPEARMWMLNGIAGGLQPWWHMVGAYHEDRRMYHNPEQVFKWHQANESFLVNREPVATVGLVWSQQNMDFYGRDNAEELVELPWRGMAEALIRARIPYLPVHADHIDRDASHFSTLILPNLAAMTDEQAASMRRFVERGGSLVATGLTSLFNEWGDLRPDYGLADMFGAHIIKGDGKQDKDPALPKLAGNAYHTYLRLVPELRKQMDGPHISTEPALSGKRHPVFNGFEETDILPFGGQLQALHIEEGTETLMTYIPQFPVYPPEKAWMREPKTEIPGLILHQKGNGGRVAFLPADIDRQYAKFNLPDHGNLLKNIVLWASAENTPIEVSGAGLIDCHLYRQQNRLVLHLVNLTSAATWRQPVDELISIGPLQVKVKLPAQMRSSKIKLLVSGETVIGQESNGWILIQIKSILDHEVLLIE